MAADPNAKEMTIPFNGGSFTTTKALINYIFGPEFIVSQVPPVRTVDVKAHVRVRVIGESATAVKQHTYSRTKFPVALDRGGSGGEPILFLVGNDAFTARLHGSHQNFVKFLKTQIWSTNKTFSVQSEKGSTYGPFKTLIATITSPTS